MKFSGLCLLLIALPFAIIAQRNPVPDEHLTALINAARQHQRDYVIESATMMVKLETSTRFPGQTSAAEVQIVYSVLALTNVTVFDEEFHSPVANATVERIPGSDPESKLTDASPTNKAWNVLLHLKAGERHTVVTSAKYTYKLPFPARRNIRDFHDLAPRDDVWGYPNTEDVIGELTILVQSRLPLKTPHPGDAMLAEQTTPGRTKVQLSTPALRQPDQGTASPYVLVAHWQNIMPGQVAELHLIR